MRLWPLKSSHVILDDKPWHLACMSLAQHGSSGGGLLASQSSIAVFVNDTSRFPKPTRLYIKTGSILVNEHVGANSGQQKVIQPPVEKSLIVSATWIYMKPVHASSDHSHSVVALCPDGLDAVGELLQALSWTTIYQQQGLKPLAQPIVHVHQFRHRLPTVQRLYHSNAERKSLGHIFLDKFR